MYIFNVLHGRKQRVLHRTYNSADRPQCFCSWTTKGYNVMIALPFPVQASRLFLKYCKKLSANVDKKKISLF